ncbi:MAG: hypothetical protein WDM88_06595 [Galbitalea sp.]
MIAVWLILMIGVLGGGLALGGKTNDSFAIPGTESQNAIDRLSAVFPSAAGAAAEIVVTVPHGASVENQPYRSAIDDLVAKAGKVSRGRQRELPVRQVRLPDAISAKQDAAIVAVQFKAQESRRQTGLAHRPPEARAHREGRRDEGRLRRRRLPGTTPVSISPTRGSRRAVRGRGALRRLRLPAGRRDAAADRDHRDRRHHGRRSRGRPSSSSSAARRRCSRS